MFKLAYFVSHPIQYQAPLLRLMSSDPDLDLEVFFFSDFSLKEYFDPGFGKSIRWDIPLTEGYKHQFLKTWGSKERKSWLQQPIARNIKQILIERRFDAIWVHGWSWLCALQAIYAAHQLNIPILLRGESNGLTEPKRKIKRELKKIFLQSLFKKVSGFLYVGTYNRNFYQSYGIEDESLFYVPYAVDNNYFQQKAQQASQSRESLRLSLGLEKERPIILFAAKLIPLKRPQDVLRAYFKLSVDGFTESEPYLLFVGDGSLRRELEQQAKASKWNSIRFLGFYNQSQMPEIYDLCDVFVMASDFEPWGLAINEVMNAGKPVVVSNAVGCVPDLVHHKENGWVFPVGDIEQLVDGIKWALANSEVAGQKSLDIIQKFSFTEDINGIKQALRKVVHKFE